MLIVHNREALKMLEQSSASSILTKFTNGLLAKFKRKISSDLFGIDFQPASIKLLKISSINGTYQVDNYLTALVPAGLITKEEIKEPVQVGNLLRDLYKKSNISTKNVAIAIPRSIAIIKNTTVDNRLNAEEIESRAWIEANRFFPDLVGDIYLDYSVGGPTIEDSSQLEMILVACRKDHIKPYLEVLKFAALTPMIVDVNCYALERALDLVTNQTQSIETAGLLNLNINLSSFIVVHQHNLIHAHDQTFDGERLLTQAETYLKEHPDKIENRLEDPTYNTILTENLISHLRHTIQFFFSSKPNVHIQQLVLSGDCATIPELPIFIQKEIGIDTIIADPFKSMRFDPLINQEEIKKSASTLMLCCGLALSKLE